MRHWSVILMSSQHPKLTTIDDRHDNEKENIKTSSEFYQMRMCFEIVDIKEQKASFIKASISLKLTHKWIEALFLSDACFRAMP
jgi:hypothetical protein